MGMEVDEVSDKRRRRGSNKSSKNFSTLLINKSITHILEMKK